jgi:glycosyltransferase involved in cell wall biosynthesis
MTVAQYKWRQTVSQHNRVLVIIPAYNEAPRLAHVVTGIREVVPDVDILVVDDGSRDQTLEVATKAGVLVAPLPFNMGYGVAVQTGFKYAQRHGYEYVVQMDADGQHEPRSIPDLLEAVRQPDVDIALGSRWLGETTYTGSLARRIGQSLFKAIANQLTRYHVTDPTTGFQALSRPVINFYCSDVYPIDYPDADVIIMLDRAGFRVREVPVTMYVDESGQSMHGGWKPIYYGIKMIMSIAMTLLRDDRKLARLAD